MTTVSLLACMLLAGGCIGPIPWHSGGKAIAEAFTTTRDAPDPGAGGLRKGPALDRFVVVTFGAKSRECFDAWAGADGKVEISYPSRPVRSYIMIWPMFNGFHDADFPGAVVVAAGHWPAVISRSNSAYPSRLSWIRSSLTESAEKDCWARIHCCLLPESTPFGPDVSDAAELMPLGLGLAFPPKPSLLELIHREGPGSLLASVRDSKHLTDADRQMVYRQFLLILEAAMAKEQDPEARANLSPALATLKKFTAPGRAAPSLPRRGNGL